MPLDNNTPEIRNNPTPLEKENAGKPVSEKKETVKSAHAEAENDIEKDADLSSHHNPEDDLDEGELARFEDGEGGE